MKWTPEHEECLRTMKAAGHTYEEIAAATGRTFGSVKEKACILNLPHIPKTPWTTDALQRLRSMWADGSTGAQIAAQLGERFSRSSVLKQARRLGLPRRESSGGHGFHKPPALAPKPKIERPFKPKRVPLEQAGFMACRYPLWADDGNGRPDFIVCGNRTPSAARSWCAHHAAKVMPHTKRASAEDRAKAKEAARVTGSVRAFG